MPTNPEPFLRWAGGKRQLLDTIIPTLPADFDLTKNRFYEPFMGGAAVCWALSGHPTATKLKQPRRKTGRPIVLNDVNDELVNTYRTIRDNVDDLIHALEQLAADTSESRYYEIRTQNPDNNIERAARTIYLNRLSFNGLYRVRGKDGQFNVPYGKVAKPNICDKPLLHACSMWLGQSELRSGSYSSAVGDAKAGDVVYFDPPYIPLSDTASFSKYAKDDFREMDQWALSGVISGLVERGVHVMFSNSNTPTTLKIFGRDLNLYAISASRSIGAAAASRTKVEEVLGISYPQSSCADGTKIATLRQLTHGGNKPQNTTIDPSNLCGYTTGLHWMHPNTYPGKRAAGGNTSHKP